MASFDHSVPVGGDVLAHCTRCENAPNSSVTAPLSHVVVAKMGPLIVRMTMEVLAIVREDKPVVPVAPA